MTDQEPSSIFRWACLASACVLASVVIYLIVDLKRDVTRSLSSAEQALSKANETLATVNRELPTIVGEVKKGTGTLSQVSEDIKLLKSVVGIEKNERGLRGLASYADEIQRVLLEYSDGKDAVILIEEVFGKDLKTVESAEEFLVGLNKEMVVILAVSKSKQEVLWRATRSGIPRRMPYFIQRGDEAPKKLSDVIRAMHEPSSVLPEYKP